jgi:hypothetical protein
MGVSKGTVLATWERRWGNLEPKWKDAFFNDQRLNTVINYDLKAITTAISKFKRLDEIQAFLRQFPLDKPNVQRPSLKTNPAKKAAKKSSQRNDDSDPSKLRLGEVNKPPVDRDLHRQISNSQPPSAPYN